MQEKFGSLAVHWIWIAAELKPLAMTVWRANVSFGTGENNVSCQETRAGPIGYDEIASRAVAAS